jgi:cell division protein ZapA (FtsZ GTPase activity inhibitor)
MVERGGSLRASLFALPAREIARLLVRGVETITTITINGREYEVEQMSDEARAQLASLQFVDAELQRLQAQGAVLQTARAAYGKALNDILTASQEKK